MKRRFFKEFFLLMLSVIVLFSCTACQPTPANAVVVGKNMQQMLDKANAPHDSSLSLKERLDVPDRFTGSVQDESGSFAAVMDADIVLPGVKDIPIVRVAAQPFDHGTVDKIKDYFFDDGPFYDAVALSTETKAELIDTLAKLKARKQELEDKGMKPLHPELENGQELNDDGSPKSADSDVDAQMAAYNMLDQVNESILYIEKRIPDALEEKKLIEVPDDWQTAGESSENMCVAQPNPNGGMCTLFTGNGLEDTLYVANRADFNVSYGFYDTEDNWYAFNNPDVYASKIAEANSLSFPSITMDEARQTADDFLKQVGIEGFVCERSEKVIGGAEQSCGDDSIQLSRLLKAYRLQYVRTVNNVPVTYTNQENAWGGLDDEAFFNWTYERITIIIDDSGIAEFQWAAPYTMMDTVIKSASMLPFSNIADIFKDKIAINNTYNNGKSLNMTVTEARLGLMRVIEQNSNKQGLLIPVWDFFGSTTQTIIEDGKDHVDTYKSATQSLLTINAIDGAVIDRQKGY